MIGGSLISMTYKLSPGKDPKWNCLSNSWLFNSSH